MDGSALEPGIKSALVAGNDVKSLSFSGEGQHRVCTICSFTDCRAHSGHIPWQVHAKKRLQYRSCIAARTHSSCYESNGDEHLDED